MKKLTACAFLTVALSATLPGSAMAGAENCRDSAANAAQCRDLAECRTIGANIFNYASEGEAVTFTRNCLNLDRRYRLTDSGSLAKAVERARLMRATRSSFRQLYCEAMRRAGQRSRICRIRSTGTGGGSGGGSGGGGPREPSLTG